MYKFLFLDLDDTILDFRKAERIALEKTLRGFGIEPTEERCSLYSQINLAYWKRLERGEITRAQVLLGRFQSFFEQVGVCVDSRCAAQCYEENLSQGHYFLPGAYEAVVSLSARYQLYLASNGTARVQSGRIRSSGIAPFFKQIFVSEEIGANKPDVLYFSRCFQRISDFEPEKAMIVGDSLTSDIQGGKNAGISTCWVNPAGVHPKGNVVPDFEITCLGELENLLESIGDK